MKNKLLIILTTILLSSYYASAQVMADKDEEILSLMKEVSKERLTENIEGLVSFGTRHSLSDSKSDKRGIGAARRWVKSEFEKYAKESDGRLSVKLDPFIVEADGRRIPEDVEMKNVMATLKGTDPNDDRIFIVSGHLDSRVSDAMNSTDDAPGANDDGSGVAAVMELARVMSKKEFPATIIFVAVSGEEQGLYGARHLAETAKEEGWHIAGMLNNDMIGNSTSSGTNIHNNSQIRVFSEATPVDEDETVTRMRRYTGSENDGEPRQLARYIAHVGEAYVEQIDIKLIYRNDRYLRGGDHTPFVENGFPAIRFCEMNENYYHQHQDLRTEDGIEYGDLPEFMDFDYLTKNTRLNLAILASLASAPQQPKEVGIDISDLTNSTTLKWDSPEDDKVKGYYVLIRETTSAQWEKEFYTEENELTIPYSKDNFLFGVQSVNAEGNRSVPVFPAPKRY